MNIVMGIILGIGVAFAVLNVAWAVTLGVSGVVKGVQVLLEKGTALTARSYRLREIQAT